MTEHKESGFNNGNADWLNYEEQDSHSPLVSKAHSTREPEEQFDMLRQISLIEKTVVTKPSKDLASSGNVNLIDQMNALSSDSDDTSELSSVIDSENEAVEEKATEKDEPSEMDPPKPQKDWMMKIPLTSIRED